MKLMPLLVAIYFVVVSTGYPNPLDTTKVDNVKDRGNHYKKSCFRYSVKNFIFDLSKKNEKYQDQNLI